MLALGAWDDAALDGIAIHGDLLNALLLALWVLHDDVVFATTELAGYLILLGGAWQTRVDEQALIVWLDTEDELADRIPHPSGCTGKP